MLEVGDKVKIIIYGDIGYDTDDEGNISTKDLLPSLIGQVGIIDRIIGNKFPKYYVSGIVGKYGPFNHEQLEKL